MKRQLFAALLVHSITISLFATASSFASSITITGFDPTFETPAESSSSYNYNPTAAYASTSGIINPPSDFGAAAAPQGAQVGFLQTNTSDGHYNGLTNGQITGVINNLTIGLDYSIAGLEAARGGQVGSAAFSVSVGGVVIGNEAATSSSLYTAFNTASFVATATSESLVLTSTGPSDSTTFVDSIHVLPEPSSLLLCGLGAVGLLAAVGRRKGTMTAKNRSAVATATILLAVAIAFSGIHAAVAAPIYTNMGGSTPYVVPTAGDVLLSPGVTHVDRDGSGNVITDTNPAFLYADGGRFSNGVVTLTDGVFGASGNASDGSYAGIVGAGSLNNTGTGNDTITYNLNLATAHKGYDVSSISIYTGWADTGRSQIQATVLYSTVANPTSFTSLGTVNFNTGQYNFSSLADSTVGALLASHVAAIEFAFPGQQNSGVGYRELAVYATPTVPEPTSFVLCGLGAAGLFVAVRRRRRA